MHFFLFAKATKTRFELPSSRRRRFNTQRMLGAEQRTSGSSNLPNSSIGVSVTVHFFRIGKTKWKIPRYIKRTLLLQGGTINHQRSLIRYSSSAKMKSSRSGCRKVIVLTTFPG